jgi:hypothetical protein
MKKAIRGFNRTGVKKGMWEIVQCQECGKEIVGNSLGLSSHRRACAGRVRARVATRLARYDLTLLNTIAAVESRNRVTSKA